MTSLPFGSLKSARRRRGVRLFRWRLLACASTISPLWPASAPAQAALSLRDAEARAARTGVAWQRASADRAAALGGAQQLGAWPNPGVALGYTRDVPRFHASVDFPLDIFTQRGLRTAGAAATRRGAELQFRLAEAGARLEVRTAYATALQLHELAVQARAAQSMSDTLLAMARLRQRSGDASALDVDLAEAEARQWLSMASDDSLRAALAILDLQRLLGLSSDAIAVRLTDSLETLEARILPVTMERVSAGTGPEEVETLQVSLLAADVEAKRRTRQLAQRSWWPVPALSAGFDTYDPGGAGRRLLPTVGIAMMVPIFQRATGVVALARADESRALAEWRAAARDAPGAIAQARQALLVARARRFSLSGVLTLSSRVARRALLAYSEGAVALPYVLQAQRSVRDATVQLRDAEAGAARAAAQLDFLLTSRDR